MIRGVGLRSAVAINVATMVGAGPFITLPLVVAALHGSVSAVAWVTGAVIALCDGLVWAELASRFPRTGGTYTYLREAFGAGRAGRLVAFLFVWQFMFWAPLILASGYIGFAQYAAYLVPAIQGFGPTHALAVAMGIVTIVALYRPIPQIARAALVLGAIALATLLAVAFAGLTHPFAPIGGTLAMTLAVGVGIAPLGQALIQTLYDYSGYGDVCALGDEVVAPSRTIPRAIVLSVAFVCAAYVLLNLGVAAAVRPNEIAGSTAIASLVAERAFGAPFAVAVTLAVMITAFASTYGLLLAASRIPYAAAAGGDFLPAFARLHRSGRFPAVSLVVIGTLALPASLLPLDAVIGALTAGIVLIQGVGQVVAVELARRRNEGVAPFRIPLYPLPPLIALVGWLFLFWSTGAASIAFGLVTLAAGAVVYLVRARAGRIWPFATAALLVIALAPASALAAPPPGRPADPAFGHAAIVRDASGHAEVAVDGKPFFFLGGAFFYERIPRSRWRDAMQRMRELGANTLDLYVPWNWHELSDGDFDFDGRTSPRRDLHEVMRLGKEMGFWFIVRPGPVIRNEWRNGGYPAWLLERPEYGMPLHDVLEGRYPATATLQNARSDAAAAEWLNNPTHLRYAARWLHRALAEFRPYADRVIAVQLDDDQAAYLDNDTYPAPHLQRYLGWLRAQVRDVAGAHVPVFINTFEMKVPSSSPVWAMGNWYQSDAYAIGEHDRAELAFATATLRTQDAVPLAYSEFQAGWLAGPEDPQPRPADPSNTSLALAELTGLGLKGLIDFPLLDTLAPFGWEAPFSNALYAWDAAYDLELTRPFAEPVVPVSRWSTTRAVFAALALYGPALEEAEPVADVAVPYDGRADAYRAAASLKADLAACRSGGVGCDTVDPRAVTATRLRTFRYVVAHPDTDGGFVRRARALGLTVVGSVSAALGARRFPHGTLLRARSSRRHGTFAVVENWSDQPVTIDPRAYGAPPVLHPFVLGARAARVIVLDLDLSVVSPRYRRGDRLATTCPVLDAADGGTFGGYTTLQPIPTAERCTIDVVAGRVRRRRELAWSETYALLTGTVRSGIVKFTKFAGAAHGGIELAPGEWFPAPAGSPPPAGAVASREDVFEDGASEIVLRNAQARAVVVPAGGGRVVAFDAPWPAQNAAPNAFDATGALRDDVLAQPPPSATDRIAKYTHTYPAGMFNREYRGCTLAHGTAAGAYLAYDAPDVTPHGARFERTIALASPAARLVVDERFTPHDGDAAQRHVSLSALTIRPGTMLHAGALSAPAAGAATLDPGAGGMRLNETSAGHPSTFAVSWRPADVESATWTPARSNGTLRLVFAPGDAWHRITFARSAGVRPIGAAFAEAERAWLAANPPPASKEDGDVAKRYTQSPQKRPSESSCGFESHLPQ